MNAFPGHLRHRNRPNLGTWYLKPAFGRESRDKASGVRFDTGGIISFQLSSPKRDWKNDPIFRSGDVLVIVGFETHVCETYKTPGWRVRALDKDLKEFEFFWTDEVPFRSVWQR